MVPQAHSGAGNLMVTYDVVIAHLISRLDGRALARNIEVLG
jgi:hypothetical protein